MTDRLRAAIAAPSTREAVASIRPPIDGRRASVLIPLIGGPNPHMIFTERASHLHSHPGQMSFPGGGAMPGETAIETALREALEEIGLSRLFCDVLGVLPPIAIPVSKFTTDAVVAMCDPAILPGALTGTAWHINPNEVAAVHTIPIADLVDPEVRWTAVHGPHRTPAFDLHGVFIWGFTGILTDVVLRLGGWELPWDASRERPVPERWARRGAGSASN